MTKRAMTAEQVAAASAKARAAWRKPVHLKTVERIVAMHNESTGAKVTVQCGKRPKYGNTPTTVAGIRFDSKGEAQRYGELRLLEAAGKVSELKCQVPFSIQVNGEKICDYVADFCFVEGGKRVVEDWKAGVRTKDYVIKRRLLWAIYRIDVRETGR